jgi:hypothetical protein
LHGCLPSHVPVRSRALAVAGANLHLGPAVLQRERLTRPGRGRRLVRELVGASSAIR